MNLLMKETVQVSGKKKQIKNSIIIFIYVKKECKIM